MGLELDLMATADAMITGSAGGGTGGTAGSVPATKAGAVRAASSPRITVVAAATPRVASATAATAARRRSGLPRWAQPGKPGIGAGGNAAGVMGRIGGLGDSASGEYGGTQPPTRGPRWESSSGM
ncbi:hypothetical protein ADL15_14590 [Actinoplanes awajinensis subsp. mycoplanecinus]|uniref:Uncharacterized protein n=1 Tax=Actinoplanes awajinensis subsp. mycoplanecinus TaxID=135947 RepID=A0A0X3URQ0_9ACTN|nr:hypothetical protein ADL15_14590 [Actinoplanes awajinensis subsp. mycoplanecinus]